MNKDLFRGERVRLTTEEPEHAGKVFSGWNRDSEYWRLLDDAPTRLWSAKNTQEWLDKDRLGGEGNGIWFFIRTLQEDSLVGFVGLWDIAWSHGDAELGIAIGDREYWGKG